MSLTPGQGLSSYEILGPLGAGAMGEVYRARDTKLAREVALKILPEPLAHHEERLQRFRREAQALAALNHPGIAQVFGIEEVEGISLMAIEFVPGEDLAALLSKKRLPVDESLELCRQVAEGVEAAHEAGVIHRDLKPANIVITPDGRAKVLDFGLAKLAGLDGDADPEAETIANTMEGRLLGTPAYMAPEQAQGKPADRRADVWAFGCILFECLTGTKSFAGKTIGDVLAAILKEEPDWSRLPKDLPPPVRQLLGRCLDKNPRTRLRDIGEARILLEGSHPAPPAPDDPGSKGPLVVGAAAVLVALGIGLLIGRVASPAGDGTSTELPPVRQLRLTEMVGMEETPALSPQGRTLAFVSRVHGRRQVFVHLLASGSPKPLTSGESEHRFPRWLDEDTLIYLEQTDEESETGSLWEANHLSTSQPRLLATSVQGEAAVDRDGKRIAMVRSDAGSLSLVLVDYTELAREEVYPLPPAMSYNSPRWSPDGTLLAFEARIGLGQSEIQVFDAEAGGSPRTLKTIAGQTRGLTWLPDGSGLVYSSSEGSTVAYPPLFSLRVVDIESLRDRPLPYDGGGYASYVEPDISRSGTLVASRVAIESDIYRYPVDGATPQENMERALRITRQTGLVQVPSASPGGDEVAYLSNRGGHANIWIASLADPDNPRRLTNEQDPDTIIGLPLWSPDGEWITYWRGPPHAMSQQWLITPDGNERNRKLLVECRGGASWSKDGKHLYYMAWTDDPGKTTVERIPVTGEGSREVVLEGSGSLTMAADGKTGYCLPSDVTEGEIFKVTFGDNETQREALRLDLQARIPMWPHHYSLSPDDDLLATPLRDHGTTNLWVISTEDAELRQITDFGERATLIGRQVSWSRDEDGKQYIFAALMETDSDIVMLEGLLP